MLETTIKTDVVETTKTKKSNPKPSKAPKKEKKLLTAFEFSRAASVALAIKRSGGKITKKNEEKIISLADRIYEEKTGKSSNPKESKWNFNYSVRFLRGFAPEIVYPDAVEK